MHILISVLVNENMSTKSAIRKQCMQIAFMYARRMHVNCKQNECKLCAYTCKQMFTCNLRPFACMHLAQILACTCKQKIACKIRVLACMHTTYYNFLSEILNSSSSIVIEEQYFLSIQP